MHPLSDDDDLDDLIGMPKFAADLDKPSRALLALRDLGIGTDGFMVASKVMALAISVQRHLKATAKRDLSEAERMLLKACERLPQALVRRFKALTPAEREATIEEMRTVTQDNLSAWIAKPEAALKPTP